jgi:putative spermidine/putrescine transport system permease protein
MQHSAGIPFVAPMLILSAAGFVLPLALLCAFSFVDAAGQPTLQNYRTILSDPFVLRVLLDTLLLGFQVVVLTTLLGVPIALLYWHAGPRARGLLVFLTLLPMLTSNVVRTFAWIVILGRNGPISQAMVQLSLFAAPQSLLFNETALVVALTQIELPLLVLPMMAVMSRADASLAAAAETLGAGPWRIAWSVVLPLAAPGMLAGWVLVFASATTSYVTQSVIAGARYIYLPQFIYREVSVLFRWPSAAAIAFVLLLSTGVIMGALASLARHPRLASHG